MLLVDKLKLPSRSMDSATRMRSDRATDVGCASVYRRVRVTAAVSTLLSFLLWHASDTLILIRSFCS